MEGYSIVKLIGEGSFGKVYKARQKGTGHVVAMKFIVKKGKNEKELRSLRSEIDILTKLNHDNIITLFESFETAHEFVLVMEYAQGELFETLEEDKRLPEDVVRRIAKQLVQALYYLHSNRIIHRDMKPQNILIGQSGAVKLADFGLARSMSYNTMVLTSVKGTPLYMAPELVQEQPYNHCADLWSLGCILYELYYGKPPFFTNNLYTLINRIVWDPVKLDEPISPDFKHFLKGLLTKSFASRLNWPQLLDHPFVLLTKDDDKWRSVIKQHDTKLKMRMELLGRLGVNRCGLKALGASGTAAASRFPAISNDEDQQDDTFNAKMVEKLLSNQSSILMETLKTLILSAESITRTPLRNHTVLERIPHLGLLPATLRLITSEQVPDVLRLALKLLRIFLFPESMSVFPFPSQHPLPEVTDELMERASLKQVDLIIRQHVAVELMQKPHTALDFLVDEITYDTHSCREECVKILFQCIRWENGFGAMLTQLKSFPSLWTALLESVTDEGVSRKEISFQYAAVVFHAVPVIISHIKLAAPHCIQAKKVSVLMAQGLSALCYYDPCRARTNDLLSVAELSYAASGALLCAFVHRELKDVVTFDAADILMDGLCGIIEGVRKMTHRPVVPRSLGSSYGYPDYGLLDGVVHMISVIFSDPSSDVYKRIPGKAEYTFLENDKSDLFHVLVGLIRDSDPKMELCPNGVQTALRSLQQVLQQQREKVSSMSLLMEPIPLHYGEQSQFVSLIALVCRQLKTEYLQQLYYWPECRGGGAIGVSAHLNIVSQILAEAFRPTDHDSAADDRIIREVHQIVYKERLMELLVHALDNTEIAFWGTPFAIIAKLVNSSLHFASAFVDSGGLQGDRMRRVLDYNRASTSLISDGLNVLSQLARLSKEFYVPIHNANFYDVFAALLRHSEKDVRSKMCTLIGNLCKHSAYFYEPLGRSGIMDGLVRCCSDKDASTPKFAAFATGNAAFHSDFLYDQMRPAIPALVELLSSPDEKTRQNAAGALSNFVRNGSQLIQPLLECKAVEALLNILKFDTLSLKRIAIITVTSFCSYKECQTRFIELGLMGVLHHLEQNPATRADPTVEKYLARLKQRLDT